MKFNMKIIFFYFNTQVWYISENPYALQHEHSKWKLAT